MDSLPSERMKKWTNVQVATHSILLIFLVVDIARSFFILIYEDLLSPSIKAIYVDELRIWALATYGFMLFGSFPVIALVIKLHKDQLHKLNVDKYFTILLVIAGLIGLYTLPYNIFAIIALCYLIYLLYSGKAQFAVINLNARWMFMILGSTSILMVILASSFVGIVKTDPSNLSPSLSRLIFEIIPSSIFEEAIYRGMLFMLTKDLGLTETKSFCLQVFLFWIGHVSYLLRSPIFFWAILPVLSLILTYIASRSRSLMASSVIHILYNILAFFTRVAR